MTGLLGLVAGCGASPKNVPIQAPLREKKPIPVCTTQLAPVQAAGEGQGVVRDLPPEQWLEVVVPGFDEEKGIDPTSVDCTGHYVFANESLRGGVSLPGWPRLVDPEELQVRAGPRGMRVLWLRVLKYENGDDGGPVALVRAIDDRAEVYAVGSFRGPPETELDPVRLGNESLVVAEAKSCPSPSDCRKRAFFFLPRRGRLIEAATVDLERTAIVPSVTARGLYAKYNLRTDITYRKDGIFLLEQVTSRIIPYEDGARDSDRELRRVEFSRLLKLERDALFSTNDPLWERVVGQD